MLDIGFDGDGKLTTDYGFGNDSAQAIALQSGNRIIVDGIAWNGVSEDFGLARYLADGTLDRSFGINGGVRTEIFGDHNRILGLDVQPDDKILVVGSAFFIDGFGKRQSDFVLARYLSDGTLDPTFGNNAPGISTVDFFGGTDDFARSVTILNNGQILVSGDSFNPFNNTSDFAVARLNSNGALDTTFGNGGGVLTDFDGGNDAAFSVDVLPDGRILATGEGFIDAGLDVALAAYNSDGSLDTQLLSSDAISPPGTITTDFALGDDSGVGTFLQTDGVILMATT